MQTQAYRRNKIPSINSLITGLTIYSKTDAGPRRSSFFSENREFLYRPGLGQIKNKFNSEVPPAVVLPDIIRTVIAEGAPALIQGACSKS